MISIISGNEPYLISKKIEDIINNHQNSNISKFDGNSKEFNVNDIVSSLTNIGLFSENNLVIVKDPTFLIKKCDEKEVASLLDYCKDPYYENDLIFYTLDNAFNEKLKVFKDILSNAENLKFNQLKRNDYVNECIQILKNRKLKLTKEAFNILINACNNSISIFSQNLDVLEIYPDEINEDVVNTLIIANTEDNVYNLINSITNKNVSSSITYLNKLLANDDNVLGLVSLLATQLRFLYIVSYYNQLGCSINQIMDLCNVKSRYRIEMALKNIENLSTNEILKLLNKLADLDLKFKLDSEIDNKSKLEIFILSLINNYEKS